VFATLLLQVLELLRSYGEVKYLKLMLEKDSGRSRVSTHQQRSSSGSSSKLCSSSGTGNSMQQQHQLQ
jgi:hypothetical protein